MNIGKTSLLVMTVTAFVMTMQSSEVSAQGFDLGTSLTETSKSEIRMAILQSDAILRQLTPALERKMVQDAPDQDAEECMGSFIPGQYEDVAPDGGPCIAPFPTTTEVERWQPTEKNKIKKFMKSTTQIKVLNPILKNPKEAFKTAELTFLPEHDLSFEQLIQAPQYYEESSYQYSDSPGFAFILNVPDLLISTDANVHIIYEQDSLKSTLIGRYDNESDIPAEYKDIAIKKTNDNETIRTFVARYGDRSDIPEGELEQAIEVTVNDETFWDVYEDVPVPYWAVYEANSITPDLLEGYFSANLDIQDFSVEGVSLFGFVRPYLDSDGEIQVEVHVVQTTIYEIKAKSVSGYTIFIVERPKRCVGECNAWRGADKRTLRLTFPVSISSNKRKDALLLIEDGLKRTARKVRDAISDVGWVFDNVIEPVYNTMAASKCFTIHGLSLGLIDAEDCYETVSLDIDVNDLVAKVKAPNIKAPIINVLEDETRAALNDSVLSDSIKTPIASIFSVDANQSRSGTETSAQTELTSLSVWGANPFDEEFVRNPLNYKPYETETTMEVTLSTTGRGDSCAADLLSPVSFGDPSSYEPSFDSVPTDSTVDRLSDAEDSPFISKAQVERLIAEAKTAPLYDQQGPAAQAAVPFGLFANGIYHHAKQGQLCKTIPVPVDTPSGTVTVQTQLKPAGAPRVTKGVYTPIRPTTLPEAKLILDARAQYLERIGEYSPLTPLVVYRSPTYNTAQINLAHNNPVSAIQVDLPFSLTGKSVGSLPSVGINAAGLISVFLEPATNCTNDNLEFEIKAIIFSQISGSVTISSPFGSTTQPITPTNTVGQTATDRINRDLYEEFYRPTYELMRRPEYVCGLPTNDHIYSVRTLPHANSRIDLGFKATLVDELGLSLHLSNFTIHENYLLGDATFKSQCSRGPVNQTAPKHNQQFCLDYGAQTNEIIPGARDYQSENELINSVIEMNEILHSQWAAAIQQEYGYEAVQAFQDWLEAQLFIGPFVPEDLTDKFLYEFQVSYQSSPTQNWVSRYNQGQ
ncbi:MAG: hypothetical protein VYC39_16630 [Myxococcota bacterium]|nr:hypothetical protein [Myxococcota bacterium]